MSRPDVSRGGPPHDGAALLPVVPTPRRWGPTGGELTLPDEARLVAGRGTAAVRPLLAELRGATGLALPVISGSARPGDIVLREDPGADLPPQGYALEVGDTATVTATDPAGAFYGLQTVLKLLLGSGDGRALPRGAGRDWPAATVRGAMLDLGRRYWSIEYLRAFVRRLAWLGGNRLQLHLTEWNAFRVRLADPRFADLAAAQAYSAGQLRDLVAYARGLHVEVVPEIDLPAHATALIERRPDLRFTGTGAGAANSGERFTGVATDGWTIDITRPENRAWVRELLTAFAAELDAATIHIGADEWQSDAELAGCADLVAYARSLDPSYGPTDALVTFVNELVTMLRAQDRAVELWSWWEIASLGRFQVWPDPAARITAWPRQPRDLAVFLDHGYRVIASPMATHYVTPCGFPGNRPHARTHLVPDVHWLYEHWDPACGGGLDGYQVCVWADHATDQPDAYFDWYLRRPLEATLDRLWGGPRRGTIGDFLDVVDAQPPPDRPPRDRALAGTPRTWDGYPGIALTEPARVTGVRLRPQPPGPAAGPPGPGTIGYVPADGPTGQWPPQVHAALDALIGARLQGADVPTGPWTDLAVLALQPAPTWNELPITADRPYRLLRYVPPDGSPPVQVQWLGRPQRADTEPPG